MKELSEKARKYLSDKAVAERYDVHRTSIWRWAKSGQLPKPVKINGSTRWDIAALEAWEQGGSHA